MALVPGREVECLSRQVVEVEVVPGLGRLPPERGVLQLESFIESFF